MKNLSIIIVNFNTDEYVRDCLISIQDNLTLSDYEIIVVDNNSPNRSIEKLITEFKNVEFILLNKNKGFGSGCNTGFLQSKGEYILFLNPDVKVKKDSIEKLIDNCKTDKNIGIVSGLLTDEENKISYSFNSFPDLSWEIKEAYGICLERTIMSLLNRSEIKNKVPFEVDWFHGACFLIRRDIFESVNGFDENIFLYYEDVDLQKRIKELGLKIVCIPSAEFYHQGKSSISEDNLFDTYHRNMHISKIYYYKKNNMRFKLLIIRILYISGAIVKSMSLFIRPNMWGKLLLRLKQYSMIIRIYLNLEKQS